MKEKICTICLGIIPRDDIYGGICQTCRFGNEKQPTLYEKALEVNGKDFRIDKAIEEMAELTKALLNMKYGRPHNSEEEFVDVEITLGIVKLILDSDKIEEFRPIKNTKLYKAIMVGE